jgi:hypothetical protein
MRAVERAMVEAGELPASSGSGGSAQAGQQRQQQQQATAGQKAATGDAPPSRVVSLGSFSKMLAPGLRLGWAEACGTTLKRLRSCGVLISGGGALAATGRGFFLSGGSCVTARGHQP